MVEEAGIGGRTQRLWALIGFLGVLVSPLLFLRFLGTGGPRFVGVLLLESALAMAILPLWKAEEEGEWGGALDVR